MATKEEVLEDFLKTFRICLNFILLYSKEHKSFLKAVSELEVKTRALLAYLDPIEIIFTPDSLTIEGVNYSKMSLHRELAAIFHQRKVQSLKIDRGVTEEELVALMAGAALAPKEIIKSGGLSTVIARTLENPHFTVEDLDYSQLLRGEGEEVKDIWLFMMSKAVAKADQDKIREFADNFELMIQKFKVRELVDDEELKDNLHKFLDYLKKTDRERFMFCSKAILKLILKDRSTLVEAEKAGKLRAFLSELSPEDFSRGLWDAIVNDEKFDVTNFQLFSKLLGEDEHAKVAETIAASLSDRQAPKIAGNVIRKVRELFSSESGNPLVSDIYRRALMSAGGASVFEESFAFDRKQLEVNYRYILLNLLLEEKNPQRLEAVLEKFLKEWDKIAAERDQVYLQCLGGVLGKKKSEYLALPSFLELCRKFYNFVESFIWEDDPPPGFDHFFELMETSSFGVDLYLKKMFDEGKINIRVLRAFFNFFPSKLQDFYDRLKEKRADIDVVAKVVDALKEINSPLILPVMENIYHDSSDIIKIEILQVMARTGRYNREFIFEILKSPSAFLKKEALEVISEARDYQKAMELLFLVPNPWGRNNALLMENLGLVEESGYKQALEYLEFLDRATPFWNFGLKRRIKEVIGRLNG